MIKLIGIIMTLVACGGIGLFLAHIHENRPRQLYALESAMQLLETEILYGATPLKEAMELVAQTSDPEIAILFGNTARELSKMEGATAREAWSSAVENFSKATILKKEDLKILQRFGTTLGISDREDQEKHIRLTKSQLKIAATNAETVARKSSAVYRYLGFLGGLFLVLALY